jgi:hypothetical protein
MLKNMFRQMQKKTDELNAQKHAKVNAKEKLLT